MKKISILLIVVITTILNTASVYAKNVDKELVINQSDGITTVTLKQANKKFKPFKLMEPKFGPFEITEAKDADCVRLINTINLKTFMIKVRKGDDVTFYIYRIGKSLKKLGEFVTDKTDKCCPIMRYMSGKYYFKQRHQEGEPEHVRFAVFNSKLDKEMDELVQTSDNGCADYSNYKYFYVNAPGNLLQVYKTGKTLEKLYEKPTDDSIDYYELDGYGNLFVVYTNNTIAQISKKGVNGPFTFPETIGAQDCLKILQVKKNKIMVKIRKENGDDPDTMYFCIFSISKNGLKLNAKSEEVPNGCPISLASLMKNKPVQLVEESNVTTNKSSKVITDGKIIFTTYSK